MIRDENGRFAKGNGGGPGRPKRAREERFYEILITTVSFEDWKRIVERARDQALRGDAVARKWLADYLIGEPEKNVNLKTDVIEVFLKNDD
jgi:hypothetical protein